MNGSTVYPGFSQPHGCSEASLSLPRWNALLVSTIRPSVQRHGAVGAIRVRRGSHDKFFPRRPCIPHAANPGHERETQPKLPPGAKSGNQPRPRTCTRPPTWLQRKRSSLSPRPEPPRWTSCQYVLLCLAARPATRPPRAKR